MLLIFFEGRRLFSRGAAYFRSLSSCITQLFADEQPCMILSVSNPNDGPLRRILQIDAYTVSQEGK